MGRGVILHSENTVLSPGLFFDFYQQFDRKQVSRENFTAH